jgi:hypothetical protein
MTVCKDLESIAVAFFFLVQKLLGNRGWGQVLSYVTSVIMLAFHHSFGVSSSKLGSPTALGIWRGCWQCKEEHTAHLMARKQKKRRKRLGSHNPLQGHIHCDLRTSHLPIVPPCRSSLQLMDLWETVIQTIAVGNSLITVSSLSF